MNKMRRFYQNHIKRKMFNRIILIYSAGMMILFVIAAIMVYQFQVQRIIREETDANLKNAHMLSIYLNQQYENIQTTVQQIYGEAALSDDLVYFLNNQYERYLSHRLDLFSHPGEQRTRSFSSLFKSYMEQNPGAAGVTIFSYPKDFHMKITPNSQQLNYEIGSKEKWDSWFAYRKRNAWDTADSLLSSETMTRSDEASSDVQPIPQLSSGVTSDHLPNLKKEQIHATYSYARELQDPWTMEKIGMMLVEFDAKQLSSWLETRTSESHGRILVMSSQGTVLYDTQGEYFGETYPFQQQLANTEGWVDLNEPSRVNVLNIGNTGLSVVGIISKSAIQAGTLHLRNTLIIVTLLFIGAGFMITATVMRSYSKKVQRITRSMSRIGEGDLSIRIQMPGEDELQQISTRVNDMCMRLEQYIDKMYASELKQKQAELIALQSQINPHFLYNTLESIRMKAYTNGARDVGQMIYSLSIMFKSMVKKDTIVTIKEEMDLCSSYLDLFRMRYEGRLKVNIRMDSDIGDCKMIKLLIQPIVENFIIHGFNSLENDNEITVSAVLEQGRIVITVADNGKGISPERLEEIQLLLASPVQSSSQAGSSIGMINVHDRIRMNYGEDYGIRIQSTEGQGTVVRMEIPVIREEFIA